MMWGCRSNFLGHSVVGLPADVPGVLAVRSSRYAGRVVFIDPADRRVVFAADVLRLEVAGERDFSVHPAFALRVSPGGSVRHPGPGGVRIFVDHAWAGRLVVLESDRDGWVSVSDLHRGDVRVRRRWASLVGNVAPVADERVEVVPDDVVSIVVPVGADGLVDIPGQPLVGLGYANREIGAWDSGPGVVTLFDPHTRVVLAVGPGVARSTERLNEPLPDDELPPAPEDVEARLGNTAGVVARTARRLWAAMFAVAEPVSRGQMVDGRSVDPFGVTNRRHAGLYVAALEAEGMLREIARIGSVRYYLAVLPDHWSEQAKAYVRDWANGIFDPLRRQRALFRIDNPLSDEAFVAQSDDTLAAGAAGASAANPLVLRALVAPAHSRVALPGGDEPWPVVGPASDGAPDMVAQAESVLGWRDALAARVARALESLGSGGAGAASAWEFFSAGVDALADRVAEVRGGRGSESEVREALGGLWTPYAVAVERLRVDFLPSWGELVGRSPAVVPLPETMEAPGRWVTLQFRKALLALMPLDANRLAGQWNAWVSELGGRVDRSGILDEGFALVSDARTLAGGGSPLDPDRVATGSAPVPGGLLEHPDLVVNLARLGAGTRRGAVRDAFLTWLSKWEFEQARQLSLQQEREPFDRATFRRRIRELGITYLRQEQEDQRYLDGDCYYRNVIWLLQANGGYDYLLAVFRAELDGRVPADEDQAIELLRELLYRRLKADFAVANLGLPSRYAEWFRYDQPVGGRRRTPEDLQEEWLGWVRGRRLWNHDIGDAIVEVTAVELGIPMLLVQQRNNYPLGPDGVPELQRAMVIMRTPNHYQAGRWLQPVQAPRWDDYRPASWSSEEPARALLDQDLDLMAQQYQASHDGLSDSIAGVPADERATFASGLAAWESQRQDVLGESWGEDIPAPLRAGQRIHALRTVNIGIEELWFRAHVAATQRRYDDALAGFDAALAGSRTRPTGSSWRPSGRYSSTSAPTFSMTRLGPASSATTFPNLSAANGVEIWSNVITEQLVGLAAGTATPAQQPDLLAGESPAIEDSVADGPAGPTADFGIEDDSDSEVVEAPLASQTLFEELGVENLGSEEPVLDAAIVDAEATTETDAFDALVDETGQRFAVARDLVDAEVAQLDLVQQGAFASWADEMAARRARALDPGQWDLPGQAQPRANELVAATEDLERLASTLARHNLAQLTFDQGLVGLLPQRKALLVANATPWLAVITAALNPALLDWQGHPPSRRLDTFEHAAANIEALAFDVADIGAGQRYRWARSDFDREAARLSATDGAPFAARADALAQRRVHVLDPHRWPEFGRRVAELHRVSDELSRVVQDMGAAPSSLAKSRRPDDWVMADLSQRARDADAADHERVFAPPEYATATDLRQAAPWASAVQMPEPLSETVEFPAGVQTVAAERLVGLEGSVLLLVPPEQYRHLRDEGMLDMLEARPAWYRLLVQPTSAGNAVVVPLRGGGERVLDGPGLAALLSERPSGWDASALELVTAGRPLTDEFIAALATGLSLSHAQVTQAPVEGLARTGNAGAAAGPGRVWAAMKRLVLEAVGAKSAHFDEVAAALDRQLVDENFDTDFDQTMGDEKPLDLDSVQATVKVLLGDWEQVTDPRGRVLDPARHGHLPRLPGQDEARIRPKYELKTFVDTLRSYQTTLAAKFLSPSFSSGQGGDTLTSIGGGSSLPLVDLHNTTVTREASTGSALVKYIKGSSYRKITFLHDVLVIVSVFLPNGKTNVFAVALKKALIVHYQREITRSLDREKGTTRGATSAEWARRTGQPEGATEALEALAARITDGTGLWPPELPTGVSLAVTRGGPPQMWRPKPAAEPAATSTAAQQPPAAILPGDVAGAVELAELGPPDTGVTSSGPAVAGPAQRPRLPRLNWIDAVKNVDVLRRAALAVLPASLQDPRSPAHRVLVRFLDRVRAQGRPARTDRRARSVHPGPVGRGPDNARDAGPGDAAVHRGGAEGDGLEGAG